MRFIDFPPLKQTQNLKSQIKRSIELCTEVEHMARTLRIQLTHSLGELALEATDEEEAQVHQTKSEVEDQLATHNPSTTHN